MGARSTDQGRVCEAQGRQTVAIAAAVLLIIVFAVFYARTGWLGPNSRGTIFFAQAIVIATFLGFTYYNWRCPACNRHLGRDLHRRLCGNCRARLHGTFVVSFGTTACFLCGWERWAKRRAT